MAPRVDIPSPRSYAQIGMAILFVVIGGFMFVPSSPVRALVLHLHPTPPKHHPQTSVPVLLNLMCRSMRSLSCAADKDPDTSKRFPEWLETSHF